jgi:hypothetical protein
MSDAVIPQGSELGRDRKALSRTSTALHLNHDFSSSRIALSPIHSFYASSENFFVSQFAVVASSTGVSVIATPL